MHTLSLTLGEPIDWQDYFDPGQESGLLFCPLPDPPPVGHRVSVKVNFVRGPKFFLNGMVVWRRPASQSGGRLRPGVGVQIFRSERTKVAYIQGYSRGILVDKRGTPRLPVRLKVTYLTDRGRRMNFTRDITDRGILVGAAQLLPVGDEVDLTIVPPSGLPPLKLRGDVVRHVRDERGSAMGIRVQLDDPITREQFERLFRELEKSFLRGGLGDEFIGA